MAVYLSLVIAIGMTLAWFLFPGTDRPQRWATTVNRPAPGPSRPVARGPVLLATPLDEQRLGLDCLLSPVGRDGGRRPIGEPVHVRARGSMVMPSVSLREVVLRWLRHDRPVHVDLVRQGTTMRARVSDGRSVAVLDVEDGTAVDRQMAAALNRRS